MSVGTGFNDLRAAQHQEFVQQLIYTFSVRGYGCRELPVDGDRPDLSVYRPSGELQLIDVKAEPGTNYSIKARAFHRALNSPDIVLFIEESDQRVHTVVSLLPRLMGGIQRPSGKGSNTDWYLFRNGGGTPFDDYFPGVSA